MAGEDDGMRSGGPATPEVVTAVFPPEASAVRAARRFVAEAAALDDGLAADLELVASEIATNAVLHARTPFTVEVERHPHLVRVTVRDSSPAMPIPKEHGVEAPTGRGLHILDALVSRWGVEVVDPGKAVWFEIDLGGTGPRSGTAEAGHG